VENGLTAGVNNRLVANNEPSDLHDVVFRGDDGPISGTKYWTSAIVMRRFQYQIVGCWTYGSQSALQAMVFLLSGTLPCHIRL